MIQVSKLYHARLSQILLGVVVLAFFFVSTKCYRVYLLLAKQILKGARRLVCFYF